MHIAALNVDSLYVYIITCSTIFYSSELHRQPSIIYDSFTLDLQSLVIVKACTKDTAQTEGKLQGMWCLCHAM